MEPKPLDDVGVALGEIAGPAGGDQVRPYGEPTTHHRQDMIEGVSSLAAVGAAAAPGVEDPAPEALLPFLFWHQFRSVDLVKHAISNPNGREADLA